jgi:hypothetical protein
LVFMYMFTSVFSLLFLLVNSMTFDVCSLNVILFSFAHLIFCLYLC